MTIKPTGTTSFNFFPPSTVPIEPFKIESKPTNLSKMKMISDCIQEMLVSNLGWDTNYPDVFFLIFLCPSHQVP